MSIILCLSDPPGRLWIFRATGFLPDFIDIDHLARRWNRFSSALPTAVYFGDSHIKARYIMTIIIKMPIFFFFVRILYVQNKNSIEALGAKEYNNNNSDDRLFVQRLLYNFYNYVGV